MSGLPLCSSNACANRCVRISFAPTLPHHHRRWLPSARCKCWRSTILVRRLRGAASGTRRGLMLWRSALRSDSTAMLFLRSRRGTRYVRFAHTARTAAASQMWMRAARADLRTGLAGRAGPGGPAVRQARTVHRTVHVRAHFLVTTEIAPAGHRLPRCTSGGFRGGKPGVTVKARSDRLQRASGAPSSAGLVAPARSADQQLTRRSCLNAASKASVVSAAAGPQDRAAQGSRSAAQTAPAKRCGLSERAFATPNPACCAYGPRSTKNVQRQVQLTGASSQHQAHRTR